MGAPLMMRSEMGIPQGASVLIPVLQGDSCFEFRSYCQLELV